MNIFKYAPLQQIRRPDEPFGDPSIHTGIVRRRDTGDHREVHRPMVARTMFSGSSSDSTWLTLRSYSTTARCMAKDDSQPAADDAATSVARTIRPRISVFHLSHFTSHLAFTNTISP